MVRQKKKQRTNIKNEANKNRSNNFTRSNREKYSIAIAILENEQFEGINIIFADCILYSILYSEEDRMRNQGKNMDTSIQRYTLDYHI